MDHTPWLTQVWLVPYGDRRIRMRISTVQDDGQIILVEEEPDPDRNWVRILVTSARQLVGLAEPVEEEEPTQPNLRAVPPLEEDGG